MVQLEKFAELCSRFPMLGWALFVIAIMFLIGSFDIIMRIIDAIKGNEAQCDCESCDCSKWSPENEDSE